MTQSLRDTPVAELRRVYLEEGRTLTPQALGRLRNDPRKGVRALAEQLVERRVRDRAETRRMEDLLAFERERWGSGLTRIAGCDEVGMGPLAGPVVAAAVILPPECRIEGVNDSKQLRAEERAALCRKIRERAVAIAIGEASVAEIERMNIRNAGFLAMRRALEGLRPEPEFVVLDAHRLDGLRWPQEARVRADASIHCVACASVVAKVHRDALMLEMDRIHPGYGFAEHKGYGSPAHLAALERLGPSPIHRSSFHWSGRQLTLFGDPDEGRRRGAF